MFEKYGSLPAANSNTVDACERTPVSAAPPIMMTALRAYGAVPAAGNGVVSGMAKRTSNENRIRCGLSRLPGSSNTGIGCAGVGPPGVAGDGVMVTPDRLANGPVGTGIDTPNELNALML